AHDALAARAVVLQRVPVRSPVVEAELRDDLFQVVEPHLPDELRAATWADGLRRFALAPLIQFHADRGGALDDVEQFAEREIKKRHDGERLMRERDEVVHVAAEPE